MKKVFSVALGLAALALAVAFNFGANDVHAQAQEQTFLGGSGCTTGTDITYEIYDINYGTATASQFANGEDDLEGTKVVTTNDTSLSLVDNCGTSPYYFSMSFGVMTGQSYGGTIPASAHDIADAGQTLVAGNLTSETTANPSGYPNGQSPWVGNESEVVLERATGSGAVGELDYDMTHDLDLPAATNFDTQYIGDWTVTIQWL